MWIDCLSSDTDILFLRKVVTGFTAFTGIFSGSNFLSALKHCIKSTFRDSFNMIYVTLMNMCFSVGISVTDHQINFLNGNVTTGIIIYVKVHIAVESARSDHL